MTYTIYASYYSKIYPIRSYSGYSKQEALSRYRKEFGLKYKRDIVFRSICGRRFK